MFLECDHGSQTSPPVSSMSRSSSPSIIFITPNQLPEPSSNTIKLESTTPIKANIINPRQDGELPDEHKDFIPNPSITPQNLPKIQINSERFESTHNAREIEDKHKSALDAPTNNTTSNIQQNLRRGFSNSHVGRDLQQLYQSLHAFYGQPRRPQPDFHYPQPQQQQQHI